MAIVSILKPTEMKTERLAVLIVCLNIPNRNSVYLKNIKSVRFNIYVCQRYLKPEFN